MKKKNSEFRFLFFLGCRVFGAEPGKLFAMREPRCRACPTAARPPRSVTADSSEASQGRIQFKLTGRAGCSIA